MSTLVNNTLPEGISGSLTSFIQTNEERIKIVVSDKFEHYFVDALPIGYDEGYKLVIGWLANFDKINYTNFEMPLQLLERFEFIKSQDLVIRLSTLAQELFKNPDSYITHLGEITESSYRLTANFNTRKNFYPQIGKLLDTIGPTQKIKILHFDDFLNSGGQIVAIFYALLSMPLPEGEIDDESEFRTKLTPQGYTLSVKKEIFLHPEQKPGLEFYQD